MKKYGLLIIVLVLLTLSIIFNYSQGNKLEESHALAESLTLELRVSDIKNDEIQLEVSSITANVDALNKQLNNKMETMKLIDDKLQGEGEILGKIDKLIINNSELEEKLGSVSLELNILKEENSKIAEETFKIETRNNKWDGDIQNILKLLQTRISIMEDGISSLSKISIERIMVTQEIDFLESIYSNVEKLKQLVIDE